jgi:GntR family transcriptional regulator / MocR family aminotransferase
MDIVLELDHLSDIPLSKQVSSGLESYIREGKFQSGQRLPSIRDLADCLGVSRPTVSKAFKEMMEHGMISCVRGSGTVVCDSFTGYGDSSPAKRLLKHVSLSDYARRVLESPLGDKVSDTGGLVNYGWPSSECLPVKQWRRLMLRHCRLQEVLRSTADQEPFGSLALREALVAYLGRSRAVSCTADRVVVFAGRQFRYDTIARLFINVGDQVAFEEPGFPDAREIMRSHGAEIVPVPVDREGFSVEFLNSSKAHPKLIYVTPSHQDPTGVTMSYSRRRQLLAWAAQHNALIIEDDYESEFQYIGKPLPSLQGLDRNDSVIYLASFWKTLNMLVSMSVMVIPKRLRQVTCLAKANVERGLPLFEQMALTDLINEGVLEQQIMKTQAIYRKRRQILIHAISKFLGKAVIDESQCSGAHVLMNLGGKTDSKIAECAQTAGLKLVSTRAFYAANPPIGQFIVPFADVSEDKIEPCVRRFAELLEG